MEEVITGLIYLGTFIFSITAFFLIIFKLGDHLEKEETYKTIREYQSMYDVTGGKLITIENGRIIIK